MSKAFANDAARSPQITGFYSLRALNQRASAALTQAKPQEEIKNPRK